MATGGYVPDKHSLNIGGFCSSCSRNMKISKALKFCAKCDTSYCLSCLDLHTASLATHCVQDIGRDDLFHSMTIPRTDLQTEMCETHSKTIDVYCADKDEVGCATCMVIDHGSCTHTYIPRFADKLLMQDDLDNLRCELAEAIRALTAVDVKQQETIESLQKDRDSCIAEIDTQHQFLTTLVNGIVEASKERVEHKFGSMSGDLLQHKLDVNQCKSDLNDRKSSLDYSSHNSALMFIRMKKCVQNMKRTNTVLEESQQNLEKQGFSIQLDTRLQELLVTMKSLVADVLEMPLKVRGKRTFRVFKLFSGSHNNTSCCSLNDGTLLLADSDNRKLMRFDGGTLACIDQCTLSERPDAVSCFNDEEAVVTLPRRKLLFIALTPKLAPKNAFHAFHHCAVVTCCKVNLFVSDGRDIVTVYDREGYQLKIIKTNCAGLQIFSNIESIAASSENGGRIYVADHSEGLVTLDLQGNVIQTLQRINNNFPLRICPDGMGGVFVCGWNYNTIIHVGQGGNILGEVVAASDVQENPVSLSFDKKHMRLFVYTGKSNYVLAFDLG